MIKNPIPQKIPGAIQNGDREIFGFIKQLKDSVYQMWLALNGSQNLALISSTLVDATTAGATELFKIPKGKTFIPVFVIIRVVEFDAGAKSTQAVASFGGNNPTYDDFLNSITYTISAQDTFLIDQPNDATQLPVQIEDKSFSAIIETPSDADVENWQIDLFGYIV